MSRVSLNFDLCPFLARVKTYTHTKNYTCTFTGSHLRVVTDADDDDDDAGRHEGDILYIANFAFSAQRMMSSCWSLSLSKIIRLQSTQ